MTLRLPLALPGAPQNGGIFVWKSKERQCVFTFSSDAQYLLSTVLSERLEEKDVPELNDCEQKKEAFLQYKRISKVMKEYEDSKYKVWVDGASLLVDSMMKKNVLHVQFTTPPEPSPPGRAGMQLTGAGAALVKKRLSQTSLHPADIVQREIADKRKRDKALMMMRIPGQHYENVRSPSSVSLLAKEGLLDVTWRDLTVNKLVQEYELEFQPNYEKLIFQVIYEAELLEQLGFDLPSNIRNVAMQKDRIYYELESLTEVIARYNKIASSLSQSETTLMKKHLLEMERHILPGLTRIPWTALGIKDYIKDINKGVNSLEAVYQQLKMVEKDIRFLVDQIERFDLYPVVKPQDYVDPDSGEPDDTWLYPCKTYFAELAAERLSRSALLARMYSSILATLLKLEHLMLGGSSGRAPGMAAYYSHEETTLFHALIRFTLENLQQFQAQLGGTAALFQVDATLAPPDVAARPAARELCNIVTHDVKHFLNRLLENLQQFQAQLGGSAALFQVDATLAPPDVAARPAARELCNIVTHDVKHFLNRLTVFPRWMKGTCLACPPQRISEATGNEYFTFSYFEDVLRVMAINDITVLIQDTIYRLTQDINTYVQKWQKYQHLWAYDKNLSCEKYVQKYDQITKYDEKFFFFEDIIEDLNEHVKFVDIGAVRVNLREIIKQIQGHALEWKTILGECIVNKTRASMQELRNEIDSLRHDMNINIKGLEDFKLVMATIALVQRATVAAEVRYRHMQEVFNMLRHHGIEVSDEDIEFANSLEAAWGKIYQTSLFRGRTLEQTKDKFSKLNVIEIADFLREIDEFVERFDTAGPGTVGEDMDRGLLLMEEYLKQFDEIEARKKVLQAAEQLFDNPLADFSTFNRAKSDFLAMDQVYKIYKAQRNAREVWARTLWVNLNPQALVDGIEQFFKEFRKLPKVIRQTPTGVMLDMKLKQFKSVVPLMVSLKNEAMRERHWKILMEKTGKEFDMSAERFTLENMFSMELHKYQDVAEEIVNHAIKELAIERGVKDIQDTWAAINFTVAVHSRKGSDRGFTLAPCDDIMTKLDDDCMSLQSMAASQFIGPFFPVVQKWEQTLSLISEVIEEWLSTQRKWLYLEGIFVGSDIRTQLPDAAKKFDDIDRSFRKIMADTAKRLNVVDCCTIPGRLDEFIHLGIGLQKCQKSLNDYLDTKRRVFPRFFFISTDELLSILGSSECSCVQDHMIKMFDNIKALDLYVDHNNRPVAAKMISAEGEVMEFRNVVYTEGRVEDWMNLVLIEMRNTNRFITKKAIFYYGRNWKVPRTEWILEYQGMVCLAANGVWWTAETEEALSRSSAGDARAVKTHLQNLNEQLDALVVKVRQATLTSLAEVDEYQASRVVEERGGVWWTAETEEALSRSSARDARAVKTHLQNLNEQLDALVVKVRQELSANDRLKFRTITTIDVHARDIIEEFVRDNVTDAAQFPWESQLRFYWLKSRDGLWVKQCTGIFEYGYEYMGLNGRLVITPLTDRIYLTLTQALTMQLGGAPAGPAGTGKTETVKDLAKALGLLCIVTNCGEGIDQVAVGRNLGGLCQCGAWGCFDEFNRIHVSALSVVSAQLQCIRHALLAKRTVFTFNRIHVSALSVVSAQLQCIRHALLAKRTVFTFNRIHVSALSVVSAQLQCIRHALLAKRTVFTFNRIHVSALSVVSAQLQCIRHALLAKRTVFTFEGQEIVLDNKVGIFITMNPGYAGRTELPESVKALFRPAVCIMPDLRQICVISLFSDGFLTAKVLAKKMTVLYSFAKQQLSQQSHYDWGLRALTAVLRAAGRLRREGSGEEAELLMRALSALLVRARAATATLQQSHYDYDWGLRARGQRRGGRAAYEGS
ncbi:unnamed protein product [Plutella xylostella]|uniref:(diamondback moth) hypothetical protein n=1 Tax=Plutella xylostella TaxID=51655 RepID=A0A8S4G8C3_PLUXY|nr:unnamed protein product [Plutella xylostella]